MSRRISAVPIHYQDTTGAWQNIDTTIHQDPLVPAGLVSGANSWIPHFAPLTPLTGVTIVGIAGAVGFAPLGAAAVAPQIDLTDPSSVIYANVWPGVDLVYTVESFEIAEHIILHSASVPTTFSFATLGAPFSLDPVNGGGLISGGPLAGLVHVAQPIIEGAGGVPYSAEVPTLSFSPTGISIGVNPSWLDSLPASAFPIDVDPSVGYGASTTCYWSNPNGQPPEAGSHATESPCQLQVGNDLSNAGWQTTAYFNYTSLYGDDIVAAELDIEDGDAGASSTNNLYIYQTAAFKYGGAGPLEGQTTDNYSGADFVSDRTDPNSNPALADLYNYYDQQKIPGIQLYFIGDQPLGAVTYHQYSYFALILTYEVPAAVATPTAPGNGAMQHPVIGNNGTGSGSLVVNPVALPSQDNDTEVSYDFRMSTNLNPDVSPLYDTGWVTSNYFDWILTGGWSWNTTYYWHVFTSVDGGLDATGPSSTWSFEDVNTAPVTEPVTVTSGAGIAPSGGITTLTPVLSTGASADKEGDPVLYDFQIATSPDGLTAPVATSGWQSGLSWTPPLGTLTNGGQYYAIVRSEDNTGDPSGLGVWSPVDPFTVNLRLGSDSRLPSDGFAGASVDLANGNLVVTASTPSYQTVGTPAQFSFTYNSMTPSDTGLSYTAYQSIDGTQTIDAGDPVV